MVVDTKEFESFEQQFIELVSEFQSLSISESQLREALRTEAARAEAAEAVRDATERASVDARAGALAASAGATQAAKTLAAVQDELTTVKMQLEFADRQRIIVEERYTETINKTITLERELQTLRPLQTAHLMLQRQFTELQERINNATEEVRSEASRLENELRRVERCASAGSELRERARLAAAAHARERRIANAEFQHTARELKIANAEITRQGILIAELECRLSKFVEDPKRKIVDPEFEALIEVKAALEAERAGTARLEKALAAALADNANLAAQLHSNDNNELKGPSPEYSTSTNICPIDSFLAE
ncbi:uncharacterized abhydrolase domain-containing protein DDB_G0269086-like [Pararge aegeria]|uniref:Jg9349 protein n=1 Tax=Pararge aegeria aegeria TaxID=348720 RepID=A0A8S4RZY5_9NEOP|nr:uncharacterized abhydrolase domain-containing protein DDB_G0269086-like [Pararge aegeria]CAH2243433.1 jg9349 [Pararge aegeria aegeria]